MVSDFLLFEIWRKSKGNHLYLLNTDSNYFNVRSSFGQFHRGRGDASIEIRPLSTHVSQVSLLARPFLFHAQN